MSLSRFSKALPLALLLVGCASTSKAVNETASAPADAQAQVDEKESKTADELRKKERELEYGEASSVVVTHGWTAAAGAHGLGQCKRYFRTELICAQQWLIMMDGPVRCHEYCGLNGECAMDRVVNTICRDTSESSNVCDRTP